MDLRHVTLDLGEDVEQIAALKPISTHRRIFARHFLGSAAVLRAGHRQGDLVALAATIFTARVFSLAMVETRSTPSSKLRGSTLSTLSLPVGMTRPVIGEGAVDQLRGQHRLAEREADLGRRQRDLDRAVDSRRAACAARRRILRGTITSGMPSAPVGSVTSRAPGGGRRWLAPAGDRSRGVPAVCRRCR